MLLSLQWLREFVPYEGSAQELGNKLTMLGLELENISNPYANLAKIVVGKVITCEKHPEADKLSVCTVDVGAGEALPIVCGAPNVAAGQLVPVATVGVIMPGGLEIKKAKLRGSPSHGMICSERELGLSEDHNGIMVLPENCKIGDSLINALNLDTEILEIGITPNRGDALSVLGLARETALAFNLPLSLPPLKLNEQGAAADFSVQISDPSYCPLYQLKMIDNITVGPSPAKIRYRLHSIGVRPISNVVDVTNYILMELGQPLHAFDRDKLSGTKIIVSPANRGEKIVTLDGQERLLLETDLLIRDGTKPVALAGVMGGANSEITEHSKNVLLESAIFSPNIVRKTSRRLGLSSESSYRYERGVDQLNNSYAMNRAASMIASLSGGSLRPGTATCEPKPWQAKEIIFRRSKAISLLGADMPEEFCTKTLSNLGCDIEVKHSDNWQVKAPSYRPDLSREADLIEEIGRVYGVDKLPDVLPAINRNLNNFGEPISKHEFFMKLKRFAAGLGLNEAINYSFVGHKDLDSLGLTKEDRVTLLNPMSEEQNVLRTNILPGLLQNVRHNLAHGNTSIHLFELAKTFHKDDTAQTFTKEINCFGLAFHGLYQDSPWANVERDLDYLDLCSFLDQFASFLHLPAPEYIALETHEFMSPSGQIQIGDTIVGTWGKLKNQLNSLYHAKKDIWLAELNLDILYKLHIAASLKFKALAVYPAIKRDITVITDKLKLKDIVQAIENLKIKTLEQVQLIDNFEPQNSQDRNLTFRLTFRHKDRTLQDAEVDKERDSVAKYLVNNLGVKI